MDAAQWAKASLYINHSWFQDATNNGSYKQVQERKVKPENEQALNCPRCNSTNTKFCYYNNYSLTQPRYFCKACKRYWTKGGSLRSVPVGGGSRKNKRSISSTSSMPKPIDLSQFSSQNFTTHEGQDLNLGSQATQEEYHHGFSQFLKLPKNENSNANFLSSSSTSSTLTLVSAQDLLRTGIASDGLNSFSTTDMINSNTMLNGPRFSLQDVKPTMGFPFQGNGSKYGIFQGNQEDGERIMLPFGVLNQQHSSRESGQSMGQGNSTGYWNETLGGGLSTLYN